MFGGLVIIGLLILLMVFLMVVVIRPRPVVSVEVESRRRTGRRAGAEYAVDLRQQRAWFAEGDDTFYYKIGEPENEEKVFVDISGVDPNVQALIKYQMTQIKMLNNESAGRRKKIEEDQARLAALEKAQRQQLEADGKYQTLYEQAQQELSQLKLRAERADSYESMIKAGNDAKLAMIPDDWKPTVTPIVENMSPEKLSVWLDQNMGRFTTPKAPELDAGTNTGGGKPNGKLTAEEKAIADRYGVSYDEYAKYKGNNAG